MKIPGTILLLLLSLSLVACEPGQTPISINTPAPTGTSTKEILPTATLTPTPAPTPTSIPPTPTLDKGLQDPESGHWYLVLEPMPWSRAVDHCSNIGGHLAAIDNRAEDNFVYTRLAKAYERNRDDILLGGTDQEQEGRWVWANGETMEYTNWASGEPNNCAASEIYGKCMPENLVTYDHEHPGQWNDVPAGGGTKFLCEFED